LVSVFFVEKSLFTYNDNHTKYVSTRDNRYSLDIKADSYDCFMGITSQNTG